MAAATPAPSFMKQLAANDKSTRDRAVDNLRIYLRSRKEFSDVELLKLWKGLFYCMWMSDKPRNQQQLARDLAALIEVVQRDMVVPFLEAFWKTMAREWNGIGQLRMDKYLYLIRQYLSASFRYLANTGWRDTETTDFMDVLSATPLDARDAKIPNGMRYHMLDIYLDELEKLYEETEAEMPIEKLLAPFVVLQKDCPTRTVRERAKELLEDERVRQWLGLPHEDEDEDEDDTASGQVKPVTQTEDTDGGWDGFDD